MLDRLPAPGTVTDLVMKLVLSLLGAAAACALLYWLGLLVNPVIAMGLALVMTTLAWLMRFGLDVGDSPSWQTPTMVDSGLRWQMDVRTRRLADVVASARPGREFSTRSLAMTLRAITEDRLVRHHDADPGDPLHDGAARLSPGLMKWLSATDGHHDIPGLSRATLHAYLKEIDAL